MTTQQGDNLIHEGENYQVKPFPLEWLDGSWHSIGSGDAQESRFKFRSTGCWRGYIATWIIEGDQLCLVAFDARDLDGNQLTISDVFGVEKMFAQWFSGELNSPLGNQIYGMFDPIYEQDNVWVFDKGTLIRQYIRTNKVPENAPGIALKRA